GTLGGGVVFVFFSNTFFFALFAFLLFSYTPPAATTSAVAALALRTGATVVPLFALPLGGGRFRMIYEHPVEPPSATSEHPLREFAQRCTDVLEMYVRRNPQLWLWMHRRRPWLLI